MAPRLPNSRPQLKSKLTLALERLRACGLSPRQAEVAYLRSRGVSPKEIAKKFGVDPQTVKYHTNLIYKKLPIKKSGAALILFCLLVVDGFEPEYFDEWHWLD